MERKTRGTLPSHRLGRERCHDGRGKSEQNKKNRECVTPTCHTHGVPQEEGGQSTVGGRGSRVGFSVGKEAVGGGKGGGGGVGGGGRRAGLRGRGVVEVSG